VTALSPPLSANFPLEPFAHIEYSCSWHFSGDDHGQSFLGFHHAFKEKRHADLAAGHDGNE
jgi:hypothetical protein